MSAEETRLCQVDRYFREHIRKCFDAVKSALDEVDVTGSGFVDPDVLRAIVTKHCCPIAHSDFLYLTNKTRRKKDRDDGKVQWLHFLQVYGTRAAPHILQGPGFSQAALALRKQYLLANPNADKNWYQHTPLLIYIQPQHTLPNISEPPLYISLYVRLCNAHFHILAAHPTLSLQVFASTKTRKKRDLPRFPQRFHSRASSWQPLQLPIEH